MKNVIINEKNGLWIARALDIPGLVSDPQESADKAFYDLYQKSKCFSPEMNIGEKPRLKQVILIRSDLKLRRGKEIAQGAHASCYITEYYREDPRVVEWMSASFAKVVLQVPSEDLLKERVNMALAKGIPGVVITDAGRTEFNGVPTIVAGAIGPDLYEEIDKITGDLKLY